MLESTPSTMDAALEHAGGCPGLLLAASRQTQGRGSHGRGWHDGDACTLPCTFVVDAGDRPAPMLAACAACAVHETLSRFAPASADLAIKWPNDIVARGGDRERKLAGILIERRQGLTLVGIGINCSPLTGDAGESVRDRAVSLAELGSGASRPELLCGLLERMGYWFAAEQAAVRDHYRAHDAMVGTVRTLGFGQESCRGLVEDLDPLESITIVTPDGPRTLPIAQTRHLGEEAG